LDYAAILFGMNEIAETIGDNSKVIGAISQVRSVQYSYVSHAGGTAPPNAGALEARLWHMAHEINFGRHG
jgi:hypothetical protein